MVLSAMIRGGQNFFLFLLILFWSQSLYSQVIKLTWEPNSEEDVAHYTVYRSEYQHEAEIKAIIPANKTVYYDSAITIGKTYFYKMTATDFNNNTSEFSNEVMILAIPQTDGSADSLVTSSVVMQNYPNPFNPETMIEFVLPQAGHLQLTIYDMLGREVIKLADGDTNAGHYKIKWSGQNSDGSRVTSGIYFCRLRFNKYSGVLKLIVAR